MLISRSDGEKERVSDEIRFKEVRLNSNLHFHLKKSTSEMTASECRYASILFRYEIQLQTLVLHSL